MGITQVVAIVRDDKLERVEEHLKNMHVRGLSVSHIKGYGEYADFFSHNWMTTHVRIDVFTDGARVDEIVQTIVDAAHTGVPGDGLVAVLPVSSVIRIRTKAVAAPEELA